MLKVLHFAGKQGKTDLTDTVFELCAFRGKDSGILPTL